MYLLEEQVIKTLETFEERFNWLNQQLVQPEIIADRKTYLEMTRELNQIEDICQNFSKFKQKKQELDGALSLLETDEAEIVMLAKEEIASLNLELEQLALRLKELLLPRDKNERRDVIVEIRGAAGGEEANLFALDLYKIYQR